MGLFDKLFGKKEVPILSAEELKQRFQEMNINADDKTLMPYFEEALAVLPTGDSSAIFWATHTLHELLRTGRDTFYNRIGEISAFSSARDIVVDLQIDAIRFLIPDEKAYQTIQKNVLALCGEDKSAEIEGAKRFNEVWTNMSRDLGKITGANKRDTRDSIKGKVLKNCKKLDSCSAVMRIVYYIEDMQRVIENAQRYGNTISVQSYDLQTGQMGKRDGTITMEEAEEIGVDMLAALPRPILEQCLASNNPYIDSKAENKSYHTLLKLAAEKIAK